MGGDEKSQALELAGDDRGNRVRARAGSKTAARLAPHIVTPPLEVKDWALAELQSIVSQARDQEPPQLNAAVGALRTLLEWLPLPVGDAKMSPEEQRARVKATVAAHLALFEEIIAEIKSERGQ